MIPINTNFVAKGTLINLDSASFRIEKIKTLSGDYPGLNPGQRMTGFIESMQKDGSASIRFNNITLDVKLPVTFEIGSKVVATVIEAGDMPVIKVESVSSKTDPSLSMLGKNISAFLERAEKSNLSSELKGVVPVVGDVSILNNAKGLTQKLQETISQSGLFYESHLAKWVQGAITTEQILKEPQARNVSESGYQQIFTTDNDKLNLDNRQAQLLVLVNAQFQALDTAALSWHGHIWPGQDMHWAVKKEQNSQSDREDTSAKMWSTSINLELPNLGKVRARVSLVGNSVQFNIDADDLVTQDLFKDQHTVLLAALLQSNILTTSLHVNRNDQ